MLEPSIDHSCSHCGKSQAYRPVPTVSPNPAASRTLRELPSVDLRCLALRHELDV
jgi:hypothetical protein